MPFFENFVPGKLGLRENMWCLIKGFSELIQYVAGKNLGHGTVGKYEKVRSWFFLQVAGDSLKFPRPFGKLLFLFFIFFYTSQR